MNPWLAAARGNRSDVELLLPLAEVCVAPSRSEGLSLAALEAMASGLPVVASRVGGIPEVVREGSTGLLVPSESPAPLANAICRLLGDPDLRYRLGANGREAAQQYDLDAYCARLEQLYRDLTANSGRRLQSSAHPLSGAS